MRRSRLLATARGSTAKQDANAYIVTNEARARELRENNAIRSHPIQAIWYQLVRCRPELQTGTCCSSKEHDQEINSMYVVLSRRYMIRVSDAREILVVSILP